MCVCVNAECRLMCSLPTDCLFVHFADLQTPLSPITPAARISALNIVGDLLRKLGVSFVLVIWYSIKG